MILVFLFIFITGFHDEGNLIATIITSRSVNLYLIFLIAFLSQFLGTMFLGTKVAVGTVNGLFNINDILKDTKGMPIVICSAMLGAIIWDIITWIFKIPSSSSHAIIGGLLGPFVLKYSASVINVRGLIFNVLLPLFTSPVIGFTIGFVIFKLSYSCFGKNGIRIKKLFIFIQTITCIFINAFQGSNDAQKGMAAAALLIMNTAHQTVSVSRTVILISAVSISFGLVLGGLKMILSVGKRIYSVKTIHSMSAQISSMIVIGSSSLLGYPISGTQIVNSSILGVGAADKPNAVGWEYAKNMVIAWIITIPAAFLLSSLIYLILKRI